MFLSPPPSSYLHVLVRSDHEGQRWGRWLWVGAWWWSSMVLSCLALSLHKQDLTWRTSCLQDWPCPNLWKAWPDMKSNVSVQNLVHVVHDDPSFLLEHASTTNILLLSAPDAQPKLEGTLIQHSNVLTWKMRWVNIDMLSCCAWPGLGSTWFATLCLDMLARMTGQHHLSMFWCLLGGGDYCQDQHNPGQDCGDGAPKHITPERDA